MTRTAYYIHSRAAGSLNEYTQWFATEEARDQYLQMMEDRKFQGAVYVGQKIEMDCHPVEVSSLELATLAIMLDHERFPDTEADPAVRRVILQKLQHHVGT